MKFSIILSNAGSCSDRYMSCGYSPSFTTKQLFSRVGKLTGVDGVELIGGWNVTKDNAENIAAELKRLGYPAVAIIPDHFGRPEWGKGAFTNPDEAVRRAAVQETLDMAEAARVIGCDLISIWNGQDGFDYLFQADYDKAWDWLVKGIRECADRAPDIRFSVEYKPKEPRTHSFVSNVYSTLALCADVDRKNVGVTIDTGHAATAYENLASAAVAAMKKNKLFHLHINDNYGLWDDDMITGSVHTVEYIELFWWLKKLGYDDYVSIDQYPYREDGVRAAQESLDWMHTFDRLSDEVPREELERIFSENDAVAATRMVRKLLIK